MSLGGLRAGPPLPERPRRPAHGGAHRVLPEEAPGGADEGGDAELPRAVPRAVQGYVYSNSTLERILF